MPAPDQPPDKQVPTGGEHPSSTEVARLNEALKALPAEIAESLRSAPLRVKEVRSRWLRWLAVAGVVVAIGSGIYTLVSALTTPSVVRSGASPHRGAARPRPDRARRTHRPRSGPLPGRAGAARARASGPGGGPAAALFSIGSAFRVTVDRGADGQGDAEGLLGGWRARIAPAR